MGGPTHLGSVLTVTGLVNSQAYVFTRNFKLLCSVPPGVVTVTKPVVAPWGTVAVR